MTGSVSQSQSLSWAWLRIYLAILGEKRVIDSGQTE